MSTPYTTLALTRVEYLALLAALDDRVERCEQRVADEGDDDDYWREARDVAASLLDRLDRLAA